MTLSLSTKISTAILYLLVVIIRIFVSPYILLMNIREFFLTEENSSGINELVLEEILMLIKTDKNTGNHRKYKVGNECYLISAETFNHNHIVLCDLFGLSGNVTIEISLIVKEDERRVQYVDTFLLDFTESRKVIEMMKQAEKSLLKLS